MKYLHVTPVIGLPQVTGWSQVAENPHTAQNRCICAFALRGDGAGNVGRDITEDIAQFEPHTLEEAYNFFENLEKRYQDTGVSFYFAAGIFLHSQVAYVVKGGSVLLKRDDKVGSIVHSVGDIKLVTGTYTLDDIIVLATNQATGFFNEVEQKFKTGFDTDTIITSIVPGLHSQQDSSLSAMAFIAPSEKPLVDEDDEEVLLEASIETDAQQSAVVVQEDIMEESSPSPAHINLDDVEVPSEGVVAELGLREPPPKANTSNSVVLKIWRLIRSSLVAVWGVLTAMLTLLLATTKSFGSRVRWFRLSQLQPRNMFSTMTRFTTRSQYLNQGKSRRWLRVGAVAMVFLIAIGVGLYMYMRQVRRTRLAAREDMAPLVSQLESARENVANDPVTAREAVATVVRELEALRAEQEELGNSIFVEEINQQLLTARSLHEQISGREAFAELPIFYDLRLVDSDFVVTGADVLGATAGLVDNEQKQLVILDLESKQPITVSLGDIGEIIDVHVRENDVLLLADGIYSVPLEEDGMPEVIIPEGDSNREAMFLSAYDRYVYVLNPDSRNIYRYAQEEADEFSEPVGWMQAARGLVYDTVSSWSIDGDIWITTAEGEVLRFTRGEAVDYTINGMSEPFNSSLRIATLVDSESLYILEPENRRLVELAKNGDFLREVKSASLASSNSLIISESLGKAFAVSGSILFEIEL